jgi:hypothetical protein
MGCWASDQRFGHSSEHSDRSRMARNGCVCITQIQEPWTVVPAWNTPRCLLAFHPLRDCLGLCPQSQGMPVRSVSAMAVFRQLTKEAQLLIRVGYTVGSFRQVS